MEDSFSGGKAPGGVARDSGGWGQGGKSLLWLGPPASAQPFRSEDRPSSPLAASPFSLPTRSDLPLLRSWDPWLSMPWGLTSDPGGHPSLSGKLELVPQIPARYFGGRAGERMVEREKGVLCVSGGGVGTSFLSRTCSSTRTETPSPQRPSSGRKRKWGGEGRTSLARGSWLVGVEM